MRDGSRSCIRAATYSAASSYAMRSSVVSETGLPSSGSRWVKAVTPARAARLHRSEDHRRRWPWWHGRNGRPEPRRARDRSGPPRRGPEVERAPPTNASLFLIPDSALTTVAAIVWGRRGQDGRRYPAGRTTRFFRTTRFWRTIRFRLPSTCTPWPTPGWCTTSAPGARADLAVRDGPPRRRPALPRRDLGPAGCGHRAAPGVRRGSDVTVVAPN